MLTGWGYTQSFAPKTPQVSFTSGSQHSTINILHENIPSITCQYFQDVHHPHLIQPQWQMFKYYWGWQGLNILWVLATGLHHTQSALPGLGHSDLPRGNSESIPRKVPHTTPGLWPQEHWAWWSLWDMLMAPCFPKSLILMWTLFNQRKDYH